jgi:UDP-glucose 4-epimerase
MYTLVTGGAGYIGSHVVKTLFQTNKNLIVIDNLVTGNINNTKYGTFICVDITNINDMENRVFRKYNITNVIHVVGKAFASESFSKINEYYTTNVIGTINILNLMIKYNIKNIVFSSSCSVYGNTINLPITEETMLNPISPYGMTKKICEDIIINYSKTQNLNYIILRYFNVAGNDNEYDVFDNENNFKRIIPSIIFKTMKDEVITINTKDGTCVKNYIHVLDLAQGHIKAVEYLEKYNKNLICNLGSDDNYSIIDIILIIEKSMNKKIKYEFKSKIEGDPETVYCSNVIAKNELKWQPIYTINDIIDSYILFAQKVVDKIITNDMPLKKNYNFDICNKNYIRDTYIMEPLDGYVFGP